MTGRSTFANGFSQGVNIRGTNIDIPIAGEVFWVNGSTTGANLAKGGVGGSDGNKGTYQKPFATVNKAISSCSANRGDVIYVMPGHSETVSATSIDLDIAGVTVINLGQAENQATYTYNATGSTITISAAGCAWYGGLHQSTILDCASAFTIGAAKGAVVQGGSFEDTSAILNFLSIVTTGATDNDADDLIVQDNVWLGLNTTPLAFVSILAAELRPTVLNNRAYLAATSGGEFITLAAKIVTGANFSGNYHVVIGATGTTTGIFLTGSGSTSTGIVKDNFVSSLDTTSELIATAGTGLVFHENYYTGVADASGKLWPVVDAA